MTERVVRYDPDRVRLLQRHAQRAAEDLAAITSGDPAAADAMRAVATARAGLEQQWLPLLARVVASDAMLTWTRSTDGSFLARWSELLTSLTGLHGRDLGREMAATAAGIVARGDEDDLTDLTAALGAADDLAVQTFFSELGGAGLADLTMALGIGVRRDAALALAAVLRSRLAEATARPGFPQAFAAELVGRCADELDSRRHNPVVALAYLFDDTTYGTQFLVAAVRAMVDRELAEGGDAPAAGALMWTDALMGSMLWGQLDDADDGTGGSEAERGRDPMYALLEGLARDGAAGRILFTDDRIAGYLLGQRELLVDGMRRLAAAAETAAAGADVVVGAPPALLAAAAVVASAFVNHAGSRDPDRLERYYGNDDVSRAAATILGQHLLAVHNAVLVPEPSDEPRGRLVEIADEARGDGPIATSAFFDERALAVVTDLAVSSADGVTTIRAGLDLHQHAQASLGARRLANREITDVNQFLEEAISDAARLEAYLVEHAGHRAERAGRAEDELVRWWISVGTLSIGAGNSHFKEHGGSAGRLTAPVLGQFLAPAGDLLRSAFATHEADAASEATAQAEVAADQLTYVWYRELYRQGVIVPDLPAAAIAGDELVEWGEFQRLDAEVRQTVRNRIEATTGVGGVNLDGNHLRDVIKAQQLPIYAELR